MDVIYFTEDSLLILLFEMIFHPWDSEKEGEDDEVRLHNSSIADETNDSTRFEHLSYKLQRYCNVICTMLLNLECCIVLIDSMVVDR